MNQVSTMKLVKVNNLSRDGRSRYSATCLLSKELNLEVLPVTDEGKIHFTSPTFAEIVDVLTRKFKIEEMLDLFCGSGALSKIALMSLRERPKLTCADMQIRSRSFRKMSLK